MQEPELEEDIKTSEKMMESEATPKFSKKTLWSDTSE